MNEVVCLLNKNQTAFLHFTNLLKKNHKLKTIYEKSPSSSSACSYIDFRQLR